MLKWLEVPRNRWLLLLGLLGIFCLVAWVFFASIPTEDPLNSALGLTLLFSLKYVVLTKAVGMVRVRLPLALKVFVGMSACLLAFDIWLHWMVFTAPKGQSDVGFALYAFSFFLVIPTFVGYFILCMILQRFMTKEKK